MIFIKITIKVIITLVLSSVLLFSCFSAAAVTPCYEVSNYYKDSIFYNNLGDVELTGNQRADILNVAVSQLGYVEGSEDADLDGYNKYNHPFDNFCEYNYWYYDGAINGGDYAEWCAVFVSWCARQAQIPTSILQNSACAGYSENYFNVRCESGSDYTPQPGDLFYTYDFSHVGLVREVLNGCFVTVEGNANAEGTYIGKMVCSNYRYGFENYYFGIPNYKQYYSLEYNLTGGTGDFPSQRKESGQSIQLHKTAPQKDGYRFKCWSDKPDGTGECYYPGDTYEKEGHTTLYAVWERYEVGIKITQYPNRNFLVGDDFNTDGIAVDLVYSNGDTEDVTEYCECSIPEMTREGAEYVKVNYEKFSTKYLIHISKPTTRVSSSSLTLFKGGSFELGLTPCTDEAFAYLLSPDNTIASVKGNTVIANDVGQINIMVVTIYKGRAFPQYLPVTVIEGDEVESVEFITYPKRSYRLGEEFDPSGTLVRAVCSGGQSALLNETDLTFFGFDPSATGDQIVTADYNGIITEFSVSVFDELSQNDLVEQINAAKLIYADQMAKGTYEQLSFHRFCLALQTALEVRGTTKVNPERCLRSAVELALAISELKPFETPTDSFCVECLIDSIGKITEKNYFIKEYSVEFLNTLSVKDECANLSRLEEAVKQCESLSLEEISGDLNRDGKINSIDALLSLQMSVREIPIGEFCFRVGDFNGDNLYNATDALMILKQTVGG